MSSLNDDLLRDFKDQKEMIYQQVTLFDPMATQLRRPAAQKLLSKDALVTTEILCYVLTVGAAGSIFLIERMQGIYIVDELRKDPHGFNSQQSQYLYYGVCGMMGAIAVLLFIIARCMNSIRRKNDILRFSRLQTIEIAGELLKRKACIDTIEQRHFTELPSLHTNY
jgi:hypothetical protein